MKKQVQQLQQKLAACTYCENYLPLGANPIFSFSSQSKIALVSQAPGILAHNSGVPYQDPSGVRLRAWLDVDEATFYQPNNFAILPMAFCYPGKGKGGDLPPRKECAPIWHDRIWKTLEQVELTILIGQYAQKAYLGKTKKQNLTKTVAAFQDYLPDFFPIVHPSPRNRIWLRKNAWFEKEVIPVLQEKVSAIIH
ncbi:MAG: uracil-DNA glycosylase family protein [Bacteroidota bacterium]